MKVIFSRKGFDSSAGGCASPILDGKLISLPIPDDESVICYDDVQHAGEPLGPVVEALSKGRYHGQSGAHLDPDLDEDAMRRETGWKALFGQVDGAQTHLLEQGVSKGDLFLMYGWFREVERHDGGFRYVRGSRNRHILYGWMQIGEILKLGSAPDKGNYPAWSHYHPHFYGTRGKNNVLYVGSASLVLGGVDLGVSGAGRWTDLRPELQLTDKESENRSRWKLPMWFDPTRTSSPLSFHGKPSQWQRLQDGHGLQCVGRGQEFVFDTDVYPEAIDWIRDSLFGY